MPTWPLESFIAVNPLATNESGRFESLRAPGVRTTRSVEEYRADVVAGRITRADLRAAVRERIPEAAGAASLTIAGHPFDAADLIALELELELGEPVSERGRAHTKPESRINDLVSPWLSAYLGNDSVWTMPRLANDFYQSWRQLVRHDRRLSRAARRRISELPPTADDTLQRCLDHFAVDPRDRVSVLRAELSSLPGWVSYITWRADHTGDIDLTAYLAVRFALRVAVGEPLETNARSTLPFQESLGGLRGRAEAVVSALGISSWTSDDIATVSRLLATHPLDEHALTFQSAYEIHYRDRLLASLAHAQTEVAAAPIQIAFCIDPRSEGMRRHLELQPGIETFGFAGFFGVPIRFARYRARSAVDSLPALLTARHSVTERPTHVRKAAVRVGRQRFMDALTYSTHLSDSLATTPFALAEIAGPASGLDTSIRTIAPALAGRLGRWFSRVASPEIDTTLTMAESFTREERVALAETAIRMLGITEWSELVVLCGHRSSSTNNMYEAALDCGACGGNGGGPNARAAAAIFNDPEVRAALGQAGKTIPEGTWFVAAEHDTVADSVAVLDQHLVPTSHHDLVANFIARQRTAAAGLLKERAATLPGAPRRQVVRRMRSRASDWAELYPELGLVNNAAMIVGPRSMTKGVDLERRVFLHSYAAAVDPDGTALESILTAPMVVAQWINHQYYFSALNPDTLGAGTKTVHNAIGTLGVISGYGGDLRRGLPWQSVGFGEQLLHEPQRLCVVIEAPLARIGAIVSRNQVLRQLFDNHWITLVAREDSGSPWLRYTEFGWMPHTSTTERGDQ